MSTPVQIYRSLQRFSCLLLRINSCQQNLHPKSQVAQDQLQWQACTYAGKRLPAEGALVQHVFWAIHLAATVAQNLAAETLCYPKPMPKHRFSHPALTLVCKLG